jgi:hypothetical protein
MGFQTARGHARDPLVTTSVRDQETSSNKIRAQGLTALAGGLASSSARPARGQSREGRGSEGALAGLAVLLPLSGLPRSISPTPPRVYMWRPPGDAVGRRYRQRPARAARRARVVTPPGLLLVQPRVFVLNCTTREGRHAA